MPDMIEEGPLWRIYDAYLHSEGVTIDSRALLPGQLFWALQGRRHGNEFVADALERGAVFCVTSDPRWLDHPQCAVVSDTLQALQQLAAYHRRQWNFPVVAITGSNGKTTTKELLAAVLGRRYRVLVAPGNYNNHIGLPLSILQRPGIRPQVAILELGINHTDEMEPLLHIARPTHGVLTNIGRDHMGEFGGVDGIRRAYAPFIGYFRRHRLPLWWNWDDASSHQLMQGEKKPEELTISLRDEGADLVARVQQEIPSLVLSIEKSALPTQFVVRSPLFGEHHAYNIAMAVLGGLFFHVAPVDIQEAIERTEPADNRGRIVHTDRANVVIMDAYNANPDSMAHALRAFEQWPGRRVLILGDMEELGKYAPEEHRKVVQQIERGHWEKVFLVGKHFKDHCCYHPCWHAFATTEELKAYLREHPLGDVRILLKGSRAQRLEEVMEVL